MGESPDEGNEEDHEDDPGTVEAHDVANVLAREADEEDRHGDEVEKPLRSQEGRGRGRQFGEGLVRRCHREHTSRV